MWPARHEPRPGRNGTRRSRLTSGPALPLTGSSGGSASCLAAWTGCYCRATRAALPGAPVQHGLMTKHFPSDFYVTCATVIPVLFLAVAVQGRMYESVVRATRRADMTAFRYELMQNYLSGPGRDLSAPGRTRLLLRARADLASVATLALLYVAALILIAGGAGEALALWILYRGSEVSGGRPVVLGSTLVLVAVVVTAPFLTNWSAPSQRRQLASALISAATRPVKFRIDPGKASESPAPRQDKEGGEP
jgi:hypothetical protein